MIASGQTEKTKGSEARKVVGETICLVQAPLFYGKKLIRDGYGRVAR